MATLVTLVTVLPQTKKNHSLPLVFYKCEGRLRTVWSFCQDEGSVDFWKETCFHQKKREKINKVEKEANSFHWKKLKINTGKEEVKVGIAPLKTCHFLLLSLFDRAQIINLTSTSTFKSYVTLLFYLFVYLFSMCLLSDSTYFNFSLAFPPITEQV